MSKQELDDLRSAYMESLDQVSTLTDELEQVRAERDALREQLTGEWYEWIVKIRVDPKWVADGLDLTSARMQDIMTTALGWISPSELDVETISAPHWKQVRAEQGYDVPGFVPRYSE